MGNKEAVSKAAKPVPINSESIQEKKKRKGNAEYDYLFKILILGDSGVGKSSVLLRLVDDTFTESFISTIGVDFKIKTLQNDDGSCIKFQIWDTAGQERFRTITSSYYRGAHAFLLCFDVADKVSLSNCGKWAQEIERYALKENNIVVLGCKDDLCAAITDGEVMKMMLTDGCSYGYLRTSAKSKQNIDRILPTLARLILARVNDDSVPEMELLDISSELKQEWMEIIRVLEHQALIAAASAKVEEIKKMLGELALAMLHAKLKRLKEIAELIAVLAPSSTVGRIRNLQSELTCYFSFPNCASLVQSLALPPLTETFLTKRADSLKKELEGYNEKEMGQSKVTDRESKEKGKKTFEKGKLNQGEKDIKDERATKHARDLEKSANVREMNARPKENELATSKSNSKLKDSAPPKPTTPAPTSRPILAQSQNMALLNQSQPLSKPHDSPNPPLPTSSSESTSLTFPLENAATAVQRNRVSIGELKSANPMLLSRKQRATNLRPSVASLADTAQPCVASRPKFEAKQLERLWDEIHAELNSHLKGIERDTTTEMPGDPTLLKNDPIPSSNGVEFPSAYSAATVTLVGSRSDEEVTTGTPYASYFNDVPDMVSQDTHEATRYDNYLYTELIGYGAPSDCDSSSDTKIESDDLPTHNVDSVYYWSETFQALYAGPDSLQKFESLFQLARDFVDYAILYSKIIVTELGLTFEEKTLKPCTAIGGIAGGTKWICNGILFKFALDVQLKPGKYLYGGEKCDDEKAMKSACNERKGLLGYFQSCDYPSVNFPLMAIISYRGFCLCAQSLLPISKETLIYGSADGGHTVLASDPFMNGVMSEIGAKLKLATHRVSADEELLITGPTDIEGHLGFDGKYYLIDFARTFPPEFPNQSPQVMYNLLRPNLLHHSKISALGSLCSDAFLGFIPKEDKIPEILKIREATIVLLEEVIPAFASALDADPTLFGEIEPETLASIIHKEGINCRHLGRIRAKLTNEKLKRIFLTEIVARTIKNVLKELLRKQMHDRNSYKLGPNHIIASYLQHIFGFRRNQKYNQASEEMFRSTLKTEIELRFAYALTIEEKAISCHLVTVLDVVSLLKRFQKMMGISMNARILQFHMEYSLSIQSYYSRSDLDKFDALFLARDLIIRDDDIIDVAPTISFMHIINFAHAAKVSIQYKKYRDIDHSVMKRELMDAMLRLDCTVLEGSSLVRHIPMEFYLGCLLLQLSEVLLDDVSASSRDILKYYEKAEDCFGMISGVKNRRNAYYNQSLLNLVLIKCGVYFMDFTDANSSKNIPIQHFKECGLLLKKCTSATVLEYISESYSSYSNKLPRAKKLSLLALDSIIQNPYFRFQFDGDILSTFALNSILVKHSLFLSTIKPSIVLLHFFEESDTVSATTKAISRLTRFQVESDGSCMLLSTPEDDLYPEFNIVTPSKGYFDVSTPSNFVLVGQKVISDSAVQFTLRGSHDGHYVYCEQVNSVTSDSEKTSKILAKTQLRGVLVASENSIAASWSFAHRFDSEFCFEFLRANLGRIKEFREFFQIVSLLKSQTISVPVDDLERLLGLAPNLSLSHFFQFYYFIKKNTLKFTPNADDSIEHCLLSIWKSFMSPSEELIAIATQKLKLVCGSLDKFYWKDKIIEIIHDNCFLELIPAEIALELLLNCFESRPIEFQMIFISNWMLASKNQAFADRNLFDEIQKRHKPAEKLFLGNSFLFSELISCSILAKIPMDNLLMIYDLRGDIGNLENNIRRLLRYQRLPKVSNIEIHMRSCELRKFSDAMHHLFDVSKTSNFNLQNNALERLPEKIGKMQSLTSLNLYSNRLTEIPETIGQLTNLVDLSLNHNYLSRLPSSLTALINLTRLNFAENRLASLPYGLTNLKNLNYVDVTKWNNSSVFEKALITSSEIRAFLTTHVSTEDAC